MMVREKSRNLFETGKETVPDSLDEAKNFLIQQEEMLNIDGKDDDDDDDDDADDLAWNLHSLPILLVTYGSHIAIVNL